MYHTTIVPNGEVAQKKPCKIAMRAFFLEQPEALEHVAVLLGGRRGARLINTIQKALTQPGPVTHRLRCNFIDLRRLLLLEHVYDENWEDDVCSVLPEPDDPIVPTICLLADGLDHALRNSGLINMKEAKTV